MRAKRSKKYRKLMHQYELTFGFREAYQVLVDSNFLRATDQFKMELIPALERTVQGKVKPLLTKCSLAAIMAAQPINPKTEKPYRPLFLPPPTELPLRHCSHNADSTPIDEIECLLSLLSPSSDVKKNKEHYILATAEPILRKTNPNEPKRKWKTEDDRKEEEAMRRSKTLRSSARSIPGVPIIYVKRSVMVLEPMSNPSEMVRDGHERGKFRAGLDVDASLGKRKRDGENDDEEESDEEPKKKRTPKVKQPNPLSMKKAKKRPEAAAPKKKEAPAKPEGDDEAASKPKRKRRHNKGVHWEIEDAAESQPAEAAA
ncbi:unnamed protein product [Penicillium salamii]|uniref:UTP23 sensor motif region domain-containing protein n=1 Tax=Penicillium salamii TaxID=1612424 RepID=A0A9W4J2J6_9EURO|nr:unnamed protein product [Penicillium salamii]CAG8079589.1 unnamed protein product [Penicillium salamii]CAG8083231.1 unnamed protein product [Penicillium salamii]CAG8242199.1 unnamed protein product [Penicillium salamii]CAG8263722.1 unnamed protein product [Penicillium salamii]